VADIRHLARIQVPPSVVYRVRPVLDGLRLLWTPRSFATPEGGTAAEVTCGDCSRHWR
jgi:hypothetical protein